MPEFPKQFLAQPERPSKADPLARLPYQHDESPDSQTSGPRQQMLQAFRDLMNGLVDTDLHGWRGVEEVVRQNRGGTPIVPDPDRKEP